MSEDKKITTEYFTDISPRSVKSHKQAGPFFLGRLLGKGSTGCVRIGTHVENGFQAAIKIVKKKYLEDPQNWRLFRREVAIMKMIDHPNIVKLYDVLESDKEIFLVTELVTGGELFDYIPRGGLPHDETLKILSQIIRALSHCHKFGIVHRDLKPENIILDETKNVKLGDFGMARLMKKGVLLKTSCGSPHYASPEVLKGGEYDGKVSDVWSLGVMLYAMCTFSLPFDAEHIRTLFKKIQKGVYRAPTNVKPEMADLIGQMLTVDTTKRIKMDEIQYHPLFAKTDYFTQTLVRSAPSCTSLCWSQALHSHSGESSDESLPELDEAALEDLNQLSLGWKSKEELARAILQEGSKEKFMYNLMMCTRHRRIEELSKKSPSSSRRSSISESSEKPYPSSPFLDHNSPSSRTRSLVTGSPPLTAESPSKSRLVLTTDSPSKTQRPSSRARSLSMDSPGPKPHTVFTDSPVAKTRSLSIDSPVTKVRSLSTGSPNPVVKALVLERKISLDGKTDVKETDSPRVEPDIELTEEFLLKIANERMEEKFRQIEVKDDGPLATRRSSIDSTESETESAVTPSDQAGSEGVSDDESVSNEPLYSAPPATVGIQEKGKDECETLTQELEHQRQFHKQTKTVEKTETEPPSPFTPSPTLSPSPTTPSPTTPSPTTPSPTALSPTTPSPTTPSPTTPSPTTPSPTTSSPTTTSPTTSSPTTPSPTASTPMTSTPMASTPTPSPTTLSPPITALITPTTLITTGGRVRGADLSFSQSFLKSRRLFPTYHYEPTKEEASQKQTIIKSHSSHEKGFTANVNAIWNFFSSAWKRRKAKKKSTTK